MNRTNLTGAFLLALLAVGYTLRAAYGQEACPYSSQDAVADTLDPSGYYPLEVGNQWDRMLYDLGAPLPSGLSRIRVVKDTLLEGNAFYRTENLFVDVRIGADRTKIDTSYIYIGLIDGILYEWDQENGIESTGIEFTRPFNSCYPINSGLVAVSGGNNVEVALDGVNVVTLTAVKRFSFDLVGDQEVYYYSYGPGGSSYIKVGNEEIGTPLKEFEPVIISNEEETPPHGTDYNLTMYPNPTFGQRVTISFTLEAPSQASIRIFDVQGREVAVPLSPTYLRAGAHRINWTSTMLASGVYLISITVDAAQTSTRPITIVQ